MNDQSPKTLSRPLAIVFFLVVTLSLILYGYELSMAGFPDGNVRDYDRALKTLFKVIVWPGVILSLSFLYLSITASKHIGNRKLVVTILWLLLYVVIFYVISSYLYSHLDHGQGG